MQVTENLNHDLQSIWKEIKSQKKVVTALHVGPDMDSISSCLSLQEILGKDRVTILSAEKIPDYTTNLVDTKSINFTDPAYFDYSQYDTFILLDCDNVNRITNGSEFKLPSNLKIINIDHHATNKGAYKVNFVNTNYSSTCAILFYMLKNNGVDIPLSVGNLLASGMLSDTGIFRYSNTSYLDFEMAAYLEKSGVDLNKIVWKMTNFEDFDNYKFREIAYRNLTRSEKFKYVYSHVSMGDLEKAGIDPEKNFPSIVDEIRKIDGINFAFFIREKSENTYNITFRARSEDFDVSALAKLFPTGGGHRAASGAQLRGVFSIKEAIEKVISLVENYLLNSK